MSARQRAQERDFNRRRKLILDKGFEMARNQLDTRLGQCLVHENLKENERLNDLQNKIKRREHFQMNHEDAKLRRFVHWRDRSIREPIIVCERDPTFETVEDLLEMARPRYMKRRENQRSPSPSFSTFSLFRAHIKRNLNYWEKPMNSQVKFHAALAPTPVLTAEEFLCMREEWRKQQDSRQRCLTPPSQAIRQNRASGEPSRTSSRLSSSTTAETSEGSKVSSPRDSEDETDEIIKTDPVFITSSYNSALQCIPSKYHPNKHPSNHKVHFQSTQRERRIRPMTVAVGQRASTNFKSICKDPENVAILQQVIRARSR